MTDSQGNNTVEEIQPTAIPTENKPAESVEPKLPDGVAERTKEQFDKLTEHNAQLKAELDAYKSKTSVLDSLRPSSEVALPQTPSLTQTKVDEIKSSLVDENGYVDVARLEETLKEANERARRAEERALAIENKVQNSEEKVQVREVHKEYPNLDPHSESFDPKFYELVRLELIGQMMNGEQDMAKAAKKVSSIYTPKEDVSKAREEAVLEYKGKVNKRSQATESNGGRGTSEPSQLEELKKRTLEGDNDALFKRLQASGN